MMKLSENMPEVDDNMKLKPSLRHHLPSVPNANHVEPQLIVECTEASFVGEEAKRNAKEQVPISAFRNLKMQTSEVCHKNFVIIDHCDRQSTVILHPSWLHSPPNQSTLGPGSMQEANGILSSLQPFNNKSLEAMFCFSSSAAVNPVFRDVMEPALQVQQKGSNMLECGLIDFVGCEACYSEKQRCLDLEQESLSEFHENTDEINALLSSDDELSSTGHSPSDAASNCHSGAMNGSASNILGKKRKLEDFTVDEVDDADSGSGKSAQCATPLNSRSFGYCSALLSCESGHKSPQSDIQGGKASCNNRESSTFRVPEPVAAEQSRLDSKQSSGTIGKGGLMDSVKRIKLKNNVQQLKSVIPGGQLLDTAGVLGRTIQYVKCLQSRLNGLEAAREPARPMQQIG